MDGKLFWLVSAPKTPEDTFVTLNNRTTTDEQLCQKNYKFQVPAELKVGTLDTLMLLSDELHKVDVTVENVTKKIAQQLADLYEVGKDKKEKEEKTETLQLNVNSNSAETYLTFFRWEEAKFPSSQPLKTLVESITAQVGKIDEELKAKSTEYNNLHHSLMAEERKILGNLLVRDLSDVITKKHTIDESEFMDVLFICVPKFLAKNWIASYEKLAKYVVPRSSEVVSEDSEYTLYRVIVFKNSVDEFKHNARDQKFVVRDFKFDPNHNSREDRKKMEADKVNLMKKLIVWCKTNFSEVFTAWIHLKAIRVFVESVLRYGLPTNFQAMLLFPNKNKTKALRKVLNDLYGHLSAKAVFGGKADAEEDDAFYPYVFFEIGLDFRKVQIN